MSDPGPADDLFENNLIPSPGCYTVLTFRGGHLHVRQFVWRQARFWTIRDSRTSATVKADCTCSMCESSEGSTVVQARRARI
jgi:hypothetical protein